MFTLAGPTADDVGLMLQRSSRLEQMTPDLLASRKGLKQPKLPFGFVHDCSRTRLGSGPGLFKTAVHAFEQWVQFDLGWVQAANPKALVAIGETVVVQVHALGLWSLNLSQLVDVTRDAEAFGFIYRTTSLHVEEGEERFLLTFDPQSEEVHYELEAVSKPRHWLATLGYPFTRWFQHRFARGSHQRIAEAVANGH